VNVLHLNRFFYAGQTTHVFSLVRQQIALGIGAFLVMDGNPSYHDLTLYQNTLSELDAAMIKPGDNVALKGYVQDKNIHLIHAHSALTYPLASTLAEQLGIPLVITCHGLGMNRQEIRPFLRTAQAIICTSQRVANSLRDFSNKIHVIPNGVDVINIKPEKKDEPVKIAFVSRIDKTKEKGYTQLCKAVDLLEGVEFYVATNKSTGSKTAKYLCGTDDVSELLTKTDIMAGSGRAVMEAMAAGNAVIILGRTYQGIMTPDRLGKQRMPDVSGLSGSDPCYKNMFYDLAKLTQNKLYLRQLQTFCRELAEKEFDNTALTKRMVDIYHQIIK
jgi:hypothetical protein